MQLISSSLSHSLTNKIKHVPPVTASMPGHQLLLLYFVKYQTPTLSALSSVLYLRVLQSCINVYKMFCVMQRQEKIYQYKCTKKIGVFHVFLWCASNCLFSLVALVVSLTFVLTSSLRDGLGETGGGFLMGGGLILGFSCRSFLWEGTGLCVGTLSVGCSVPV